MKRILNVFLSLLIAFTFTISLSGCMNNTKNNESNEQNSEEMADNNDLATIDDDIEERFNGDYTVNQEDVTEAVTYINENIDNIKDKDVAKKIYEHSSYLEKAASTGNVDDSNRIKDLAVTSKEYASNVYNANDDEVDGIIEEGKEKFDNFKDDFKNGIDSFVDDFMKFF
ncbi:hypothetical protein [Thomasclavelia sp.]|uniref:hypothetical protein n=1 Tax=Thomasclavelia sp. TaxID=3025757 RepID=UPI0025ED9317|nr:hypothetical protein [Thomasclavelia sp.]